MQENAENLKIDIRELEADQVGVNAWKNDYGLPTLEIAVPFGTKAVEGDAAQVLIRARSHSFDVLLGYLSVSSP